MQIRLQVHLDNNELMPKHHSAYRKYHSTETTVTKVYNDLFMVVDSGHVSALCLLDLTAAFDTVDHDLLRLRLERQFGLCSIPLLWFTSYLQDRSYRVSYSDSTSATVWVICSVPQGSVLGLRLFTMYAADLVDRVEKHGVKFHGYADDSEFHQIYN